MTSLKTLATAAAIALLSVSAQAQDYKLGDLTIDHPWTRATPPKAAAAGGFVEIHNSGSEADRLVSASSPAAGRTEIHEMAVNDGVMTMRQLENGLEIPANGTAVLKPGSFHIMFMKLNAPITKGQKVPVTLTFEKAGEITVELTAEKIGAKGMDHGKMGDGEMDHSKMKHGDHAGHGKD
ncbi:copper chaperone PCu(A)C [Roseibium polysiphoniae]|uniref:Copper chaperone PCu(A)C n=1 Tax=Roseibium polysiphoniae TaxID=2571221 RepID=A0ABR9CDC9_9HYPH|nr:copper chaperone PCu(A)C [Roseibium polysiphoniae]MBD8877884.1 copper chaperone PCu(A)C [Roseibium polysiphoniae]